MNELRSWIVAAIVGLLHGCGGSPPQGDRALAARKECEQARKSLAHASGSLDYLKQRNGTEDMFGHDRDGNSVPDRAAERQHRIEAATLRVQQLESAVRAACPAPVTTPEPSK